MRRNLQINKKTVIILACVWGAIAVTALIVSLLFGRGVVKVRYVGSEKVSYWSGRYYRMDGSTERSLRIKGDKLVIRTETQEGSLGIMVKDRKGNVLFFKEDMGTGVTEVQAEGKVWVCLIAKNHRGRFEIDGREA